MDQLNDIKLVWLLSLQQRYGLDYEDTFRPVVL
jgi:hypothetical protein